MGEGKEHERVLDDVFGLWVTVRSCCEKRIETKLCKTRQTFPTVEKVFENQFGQVVEKPSALILCLFGFMKETKFRDSSKYSQCVQSVLAKSCLPCQILYKQKKSLLSAERPGYEFSASVLLGRICNQWFSQ